MRLKRLELVGFKSFADKTTLEFDEGLTAFVGPNGCGKSNIVDAVLWVLGEQSPKALRAKEMGDLIYGGQNGRGPMGYCETSLVLANGSGEIPLDAQEVSLTRRLYRTGESEYLVNGKSCRRKDIRDLLMGTGLGVDAYSIVPQGKVSTLLQSNPRDRRAILEEAAGVSKYKAKRAECLRRLERVEQDLIRIADIIAEVQHQLRSVKLQAAKARRYREYTLELTDLEIDLARHRLHILNMDRTAVLDELDVLKVRGEAVRSQMERLSRELRDLESQSAQKDKAASSAGAERVALDTEVRAAHDRIEVNRQRIAELDETEERSRQALTEFAAKAEGFEKELESISDQLDRDSQVIIQAKVELANRLNKAKGLEEEKHTLEAELSIVKEEVFALLQAKSRFHNDLSAIAAERKALAGRAARLREKQTALHHELDRTQTHCAHIEQKVQAANSNIKRCGLELDRLRELRAVVESGLASARTAANNKKSELEHLRSRKELLEGLEAKQEGVRPAVRAVLEESRKAGTHLSGVLGMVADLLHADMAQARAVEALLGQAAEALVTKSLQDALQVASFLRERNLSGAWLVPLDQLGNGASARISQELRSGITCDRQFDPLVDALLRACQTVSGLHEGAARLSSSPGPVRFVTPQGDIVEPPGIIKLSGPRADGLISRRSELRKLQEDIAGAELILARLEQEASRKHTDLERALNAEKNLHAEQARWEAMLSQLDKETAAARARQHELDDTLRINAAELEELEATIREAAETEEQVRREIAQTARHEGQKHDRIAHLTQSISSAEAGLEHLSEEVTRLKIELAQREERKQAAEARMQRLDETVADQKKSIERAQTEVQRCVVRRTALNQEVSSIQQYIEGTTDRRRELEGRIAENKRGVQALQARAGDVRNELDECGTSREELAGRREEFRLRSSELRMKMESLCESVRTEHSRDLLQLYEDYEEDQSVNWSQIEAQAAEIRKKRERVGNVNLEAIAEQERLQERSDFLTGQRDDLEKAAASIKSTLHHLDTTCRKLFSETYTQVRANFNEMFRKLLGGGRADLILEEGVDLLEAGIDIIACPPGKNPRSITLLSGGEKALAAVALLFAVFKAKAAPFCILDEVDAALDEVNIDRFGQLLKEFLAKSQFIVITHCKRTMAIADLLYGITMQEAGVSKPISVQVKKLSEEEAA